MSRHLLPLALCLLLPACSLLDSPPPPPPPVHGPVVAWMAEHQPGESAALEDPDFGGAVQVSMQEAFLSASGERCKRASVVARQREAEMLVVCKDHNDRWTLAPRIWGQGIQQ